MMSLFELTITLTFVICSSLSAVVLKQAEDKSILVLWTLLLMYFFSHCSFIAMQMYAGASFAGTLNLIWDLYTENIPFYLIRGTSIVFGNIFLFYLLNNFPVSEVVLVLQTAVPLSAFAFYCLGNPLTTNAIIGTVIVTIGALISGFKEFTFPNVFKPLCQVPPQLYLLGLLKSSGRVIGALLLFIVSTRTIETQAIHNFLQHCPLTDLTHIAFVSALDYAIGMTPWILATYFGYFFIVEKVTTTDMTNYLKKYPRTVLLNSVIIAFSYLSYAYAFGHIKDKFLVPLLGKCQIPLTIIFAAYIINEEVKFPQKVATAVILLGGIISIL